MRAWRDRTGMLALAAMLAGCGGSGGGTDATVTNVPMATATPAATPTPTAAAGCTLRARQDWAFAQLKEWYLFPDTLPGSLDPTPYSTLGAYVDALTATARAQNKDRFFTYVTSIAGEDAYYDTGASGGFGFRLALDSTSSRLFVTESFESTSALAAGIDRGTEILGIGTTTADVRTIAAILSASGTQGLTDALGPDTTGTQRVFRIADTTGTRTVTVTKTNYNLDPVSARYGGTVLTDNGLKVGYVNLRTFISTATPALRTVFANFRSQGITNVILDLRYNGGGAISVAETLADLLGGNRQASDVVDTIAFRPEKASNNTTTNFAVQPESVSPMKIAFIGTPNTASASELVINAFVPYLHANAALIGTNTYGKPVGQIALDNSACDDRLRVIALAIKNAAGVGDYYNGLASKVEASCAASDDITHPLGSAAESSTRAALDYLEGRGCTRIAATADAGSTTAAAPAATAMVNARANATATGAAKGSRIAEMAQARLFTPARSATTTADRIAPGVF